MPIVASCPSCDKKYTVKSANAGRKMKCKQCETPFTIKADSNGKSSSRSRSGSSKGRSSKSRSSERKSRSSSDDGFEVVCEKCNTRFEAEIRMQAYETKCLMCNKPVIIPGLDGSTELEEKKEKPKKVVSAGSQKRLNPIIPILVGAVVIGGIPVASLALSAFSKMGSGIEPAEVYFIYEDKEALEFKLHYPNGWEVEMGSIVQREPWARMKKGSAEIYIKTIDSPRSTIFKIENMALLADKDDFPPPTAPDASFHRYFREQYLGIFNNVDEDKSQAFVSGMGEARLSTFSASGTFGGEIKGIRMTVMAGKYMYTLRAHCPAPDWKVCEPIFQEAARSLQPLVVVEDEEELIERIW